ncbi:hypothetical protein [Sphingomonas alpina]|uniref:Uncharacterized protein n=1 Tax=Sphingomonas alpina TaxID=653931 RepID=A0A7H0LHY7_9SPHN|nr:hypothetical protein [Sphingomonas alpina]QNQ09290.1 hypothetical protein H3Z74_21890 [Sphingomonas alpina]
MTGRPLTDDFAMKSSLAVRAPRAVPLDEQMIELQTELERRIRVYPGLVAADKLKQEEADQHIAVWRAIIADHHRLAASIARHCHQAYAVNPAPYCFDWPTRVRELRRELQLRRNAYPKWIDAPANPLTVATAAQKLECLDAVHARYWHQLFAFSPPHVARDADPARAAWAAAAERARMMPHWTNIMATGSLDEGMDARRTDAIWRTIEAYARMSAGEPVTPGLLPPASETRAILAAEARRRADEQLARCFDGTTDRAAAEAIFTQLEQIARWLNSPDIASIPAAIEPQRMAA